MFTFFKDKEEIYNPVAADTLPVIDPSLSVELNKAGSASFTLLPKHPFYNNLPKLASWITIQDQNSILWRGRVLDSTDDNKKNRNFIAEGQLAILNDSIIRPYSYTGTVRNYLAFLINQHNEQQTDPHKKITLGTVNVTSPEGSTIKRKSTQYASAWNEINSNLIGPLGGYLIPSYNSDGSLTVSYRETPGDLGSQDIRFGENIVDFSRFVTATDVFTVLIPTGKTETEATSATTTSRSGGALTIESVNGGLDYIKNAGAVRLFGGEIWREHNWSYIDSPAELKAAGQKYLADNISAAITINIDAIDLHLLNVNVQAIKLGSLHNVIANEYEVNDQYFCSKIDYHFNNPSSNRYTFGTLQQTLTELQHEEEQQTNADISDAAEGINDRIDGTEENLTGEAETRADMDDAILELIGAEGVVPEGVTVLQYAQEQATNLIKNGVEGGHVFVSENEILIMDSTSISSATNVWRWNSGGLGFSSSGYNGTYKTAMTSDGKIVADMITTGKLLAEYIALFGKMAVYKNNVINNNNIGGYIGYFEGSDGTSDTYGMALTCGNNKIAVSTNGASINGGTPFFSISNRCQCGGNLTVTGNLTVNGTLNIAGNSRDIESEIDAIWDAIDRKADTNHSHSS